MRNGDAEARFLQVHHRTWQGLVIYKVIIFTRTSIHATKEHRRKHPDTRRSQAERDKTNRPGGGTQKKDFV